MKIKQIFLVLGMASLIGCQAQQKPEVDEVKSSVNPKAAAFNTRLGLAYMQQGEIQRAKRKLIMAIQQAPNAPDTNDAMAYFLEYTGDLKEAENYYRKAIAAAPNTGAVLNNYGAFLCRQGKYQQAEQYFMQAVKDPNYVNTAGAYENAGLCAYSNKDLSLAKTYFEKALAQDPRRPQSLLQLSRVYYREHQYKQANDYLLSYQKVSKNTVESLELGHHIAIAMNDPSMAQKYALMLKTQLASNKKNNDNSLSERTDDQQFS